MKLGQVEFAQTGGVAFAQPQSYSSCSQICSVVLRDACRISDMLLICVRRVCGSWGGFWMDGAGKTRRGILRSWASPPSLVAPIGMSRARARQVVLAAVSQEPRVPAASRRLARLGPEGRGRCHSSHSAHARAHVCVCSESRIVEAAGGGEAPAKSRSEPAGNGGPGSPVVRVQGIGATQGNKRHPMFVQ